MSTAKVCPFSDPSQPTWTHSHEDTCHGHLTASIHLKQIVPNSCKILENLVKEVNI